jgi:hypothetical protein
VVAAACVPSGFHSIDPNYTGVLITADPNAPNDLYNLTAQKGSPLSQVGLSASATNAGTDLRTTFFPSGQVPSESGQVCATWAGPAPPSNLMQQGLAARVQTNTTGTRHAITVTKNIYAYVVWVINVNFWTTSNANPANYSVQTPIQFNYAAVLDPGGVIQPFPWRVCARVAGNTIAADVATGASPPAPFTSPAHVQTATLPTGWDYTGQFGWYIGHLAPGETFNYTGLNATTPLGGA